jgi:hypothetical protein
MVIVDAIAELDDGRHREHDRSKINRIVVHRCGVDLKWGNVLGYDGIAVANAFLGRVPQWIDVAKAVGRENAYTFLIGGNLGPEEFDGVVWQCLKLDEIGNHARAYSYGAIGVGCIGDFRIQEASQKQYESLIELLFLICRGLMLDPLVAIRGHGSIRGSHDGSKAPGRSNACPGDLLDMELLQQGVLSYSKRRGCEELEKLGIVV